MLSRGFSFRPTVLHISPHVLDQHTLEPNLKWVVWSATHLPHYVNRNFVFRLKHLLGQKGIFGGSWDIKSKPFKEREEFGLIKDLHDSLPNFRQSIWYKRGEQAIENTGQFSHKTLVARNLLQLDEIFEEYLVEMLASMKRDGYRHREGTDFPEGMIGRDGNLIKTAHGTHRLAAAKVVGAPGLFPIRVIGIHRLWLSTLSDGRGDNRTQAIANSLKELEKNYQ
jgi:hypothetical protein